MDERKISNETNSSELFFSSSKNFEENYVGRNYHKKITPIFKTNTCDKSIYIELNYRDSAYGVMPYVLTKNVFGITIDSINLTNRPCYMGTDTYYYPLIEIKKHKTITVTDSTLTVHQSGFKTIISENGDLVTVALGDSYLHISESIFKINNNGMIDNPINNYKTINLTDSTKNRSLDF